MRAEDASRAIGGPPVHKWSPGRGAGRILWTRNSGHTEQRKSRRRRSLGQGGRGWRQDRGMMQLGTPEVSDRQVGRTMSQPKPPCHSTSLPAHARVTAGRLVLRGPQAAGGRPPGRGLRLEPGGRASPFFLHCFSIKVIVTESGFFRTPPHATYITLPPSTPLHPAWGPHLSPGKAPPQDVRAGACQGHRRPGRAAGEVVAGTELDRPEAEPQGLVTSDACCADPCW